MKGPAKGESKCLKPDCDKKPQYRGLCWSCYSAARKLIKEGKFTWVDFEARGQATPARKPRNSARDWFLGITKNKDKK